MTYAGDIMAYYDIPIDLGPTRHGITRGRTIHFFDPSRNRNEVFAGGYTYYPDNPTRTWSTDQLRKGNLLLRAPARRRVPERLHLISGRATNPPTL